MQRMSHLSDKAVFHIEAHLAGWLRPFALSERTVRVTIWSWRAVCSRGRTYGCRAYGGQASRWRADGRRTIRVEGVPEEMWRG